MLHNYYLHFFKNWGLPSNYIIKLTHFNWFSISVPRPLPLPLSPSHPPKYIFWRFLRVWKCNIGLKWVKLVIQAKRFYPNTPFPNILCTSQDMQVNLTLLKYLCFNLEHISHFFLVLIKITVLCHVWKTIISFLNYTQQKNFPQISTWLCKIFHFQEDLSSIPTLFALGHWCTVWRILEQIKEVLVKSFHLKFIQCITSSCCF